MIILKTTEFVGFHEIGINNKTEPTLLAYINQFEESFLQQILGKDLAALFIADLVLGVPQTAPYIAIFNPIFTDGLPESKGIPFILKSLLFYTFATDTQAYHGQSGVAKNAAEAGINPGFEGIHRFAEVRWNEGKASITGLQRYITDNLNIYPTFKGMTFKAKFSPIL